MSVPSGQSQTDRRSKVTRKQLEHAARLRAKGTTWSAIREATKTKLGSSQFFRGWEREGIEHVPAGQRPKAVEAEPAKPSAARTKVTPRPRRATST